MDGQRDDQTSAALSDKCAVGHCMREWVSGNEPRRGAAAAIMANIKEGLGTESPPTSCTNGLVAACRAEPRIWSVGIEYYIVSRCRLRPVPEVLVRKVVFVWALFSYFKVALSYARARRSITNPHATGPVAQNENGPLVDVHHSTRRTDACHDASRTIRVHRPLRGLTPASRVFHIASSHPRPHGGRSPQLRVRHLCDGEAK